MTRKVEILAPAGSFEGMVAAIKGGCDAIYIGGEKYGARAYANNLTETDMIRAIEYAHIHGKKIYLTINTLVKQDEMEGLYDYLLPFYQHGLDAVIVQDFGVLSYVAKTFPGLEIHASTQMTLTMAEGANALKDYSVTRLVTSRELSFKEIKEIREHTDLEIETFVHGALCYSFSGQCLMSSMIGGRSGNRGRCAQPCRMNYQLETIGNEKAPNNQGFLLSPKDMCTIYDIPELVECGIDSFKIEGRMKRPEYAAMTAHLYRKYVDLYQELGADGYRKYMGKNPSVLEKDMQRLMDLYNRGGFSEGYFKEHNGKRLMSMERPNHSGVFVGTVTNVKKNRAVIELCEDIFAQDVLEIRGKKEECVYEFTVKDDVDRKQHYEANFKNGSKVFPGLKLYRTKNQSLLETIDETIIESDNRVAVQGWFSARKGELVSLTLSAYDVSVTTLGEVTQEAEKQPISEDKIQKQMNKTKDTEFYMESLEIDSSNDWFLPMGQLNELRRSAFEELKKAIVSVNYRECPEKVKILCPQREEASEDATEVIVSVMTAEQLNVAANSEEVSKIYAHFSFVESANDVSIFEQAKRKGKELFVVLPTIFRSKTWKAYEKEKHPVHKLLQESVFDGVVVKNLEEIAFLKQKPYFQNKLVVLDYNMYIMNEEAKAFWNGEGVTDFTVSCELNSKELKKLLVNGFEMIVYGYLPLMTAQQCVVKNIAGCHHKSDYFSFTDRSKNRFYGRNFCSCCYNVIYNGKPLHLYEHLEEIENMHVKSIRLDFTMETKAQMLDILKLYIDKVKFDKNGTNCIEDYTKGHFKRGIE